MTLLAGKRKQQTMISPRDRQRPCVLSLGEIIVALSHEPFSKEKKTTKPHFLQGRENKPVWLHIA